MSSTPPERSPRDLRTEVREGYARIAHQTDGATDSCCGPSGGCCGPEMDATSLAEHIGYDLEQLKSLPEGANMGLSCGNPNALAALQPGETVVDLGSGGGFDCYLAGPKVGPTGRVIGVDMTPEMIEKARRGLDLYRERSSLDNVEFRLGEIEHLPLADHSVDVVLSNCVINLSVDKAQVWREIARVLEPGGRVAVSDIGLLRPLPDAVRHHIESYIGCVAGAVSLQQTRQMMEEAGLVDIELRPRAEYVDSLQSFQDPLYAEIAASLPAGSRASDFVTSLDISGHMPDQL